jgi:signal transduction histidine kinase
MLYAAGVTSYAGFPLIARAALLGTVAFVSRRRTHLREGDVQMVQTICEQIATRLDRAQLEKHLRLANETLRESEERLRRWKDELEDRVRERTREVLAVTSQLSLTEQRERRKLARDLHDYLAQMLVVGQMKTKMIKKQLSPDPSSATLAQDLDHVFQQALTYTRTLIAELSTPSLQDTGLPAALAWLGERFAKDGCTCRCTPRAWQCRWRKSRPWWCFKRCASCCSTS